MRWLAFVVIMALAATAAGAQQSQTQITQNDIAQLKETIRSLQQQVAQLEQRIKQLEGESALRYRFLPNPSRPQPNNPFFPAPPDNKKGTPLPNGGYFRPLMPRPSSDR